MREAYAIIGKIVTGTATQADRARLYHLTQAHANSLKAPRKSVLKREEK